MELEEFDDRLVKILENLSNEDKTALIVRLIIFLKLNVVDYYQNCKDCIPDPRGQFLMQYLTDSQMKQIDELEKMISHVPDSLQEEYIELSQLMVSLEDMDLPGMRLLGTPAREITEDAMSSMPMEDHEIDELSEVGNKRDLDLIDNSIYHKSWELKMIQRLSSCIHDNTCGEVFDRILEDEKQNQELLTQNLSLLKREGRWSGP